MKKLMNRFGSNRLAKAALLAAVVASSAAAQAQTDLDGVVSTPSAYKTSAIAIGIGIIVWVVGKRVVKSFTKG